MVLRMTMCLIRNMDEDLKFLLPIICDASQPKVIVFVRKRLAAVTGLVMENHPK